MKTVLTELKRYSSVKLCTLRLYKCKVSFVVWISIRYATFSRLVDGSLSLYTPIQWVYVAFLK